MLKPQILTVWFSNEHINSNFLDQDKPMSKEEYSKFIEWAEQNNYYEKISKVTQHFVNKFRAQ